MKRGKRLIALFLAVLLLATSDNYLYQVLATADDTETESTDVGNNGTTDSDTNDVAPGTEEQKDADNENPGSGTEGESSGEGTGNVTDGIQTGEGDGNVTMTPAQDEGSMQMQAEPEGEGMELQDDGGTTTGDFAVLKSSINGGEYGNKVDVLTGDTFVYNLFYALSSKGGHDDYDKNKIEIELPEYLDVPYTMTNGVKDYRISVNGPDVSSSIESVNVAENPFTGKRTLIIEINSGLPTGVDRNVNITFQTNNFVTPNGTLFDLNPIFNTVLGDTSDSVGIKDETNKAKVNALANDGWKIEKNGAEGEKFITKSADGTKFYVTFILKLLSTKENNNNDTLGRMNIKGFELNDILPTENVPQGGGASNIISLKLENVDLALGSEYTVNRSGGVVTGVTIKKYNTATAAQVATSQHLIEGAPLNSTYELTVEYPRNPYLTDQDQEEVIYHLINNAKLEYTLIDNVLKESKDNQPFDLSGVYNAGDPTSITVDKNIIIDDVSQRLSLSLMNAYTTKGIQFKLYDSTGTALAKDADRKEVAPAYINNGTLKFENLVRDKEYYIEEVLEEGTSLSPVSTGKIKIKLTKEGKVEILGVENESDRDLVRVKSDETGIEVDNKLQTKGAVEFYKYGKNSTGNYEALSGVEFSIKKDSTVIKDDIKSENSGRVRVDGLDVLKESEVYSIYETSVGNNSEYALGAEILIGTFKVEAGKTANPSIITPPIEAGTAFNAKTPYYLNISDKGKFKIAKRTEDYQNGGKETAIAVSNVKFEVYGDKDGKPFNTLPDISELTEKDNTWKKVDDLSTDSSGYATSIALYAGYYVLLETEPPSGYGIDGNGMTVVKVTASQGISTEATHTIDSNNRVIINNQEREMWIIKEGTIDGKRIIDGNVLKGAKFEIYDSNQIGAKAIITSDQLITTVDGAGRAVTAKVKIVPGTYYYKEVVAPTGFAPETEGLVEFTVVKGVDKVLTVNNVAKNEFGSFKVVKESSVKVTSETGESYNPRLDNVEFKLYKDEECKELYSSTVYKTGKLETIVKDGESDNVVTEQGAFLSQPIPYGTYYLKEVAAPTGYVTKGTPIKIVIGKDTEFVSVTVANDPKVSLTIKKVSSIDPNTVINDASFNIKKFGDTDYLYENAISSGTNGVYTFTGLEPGVTYEIYETASPTGYESVSAPKLVKTVTMPNLDGTDYKEVNGSYIYDQTDSAVTNKPLSKLTVIKKTNAPSLLGTELLSGVKFTLLKEDEPESSKMEGTTDEKGEIVWDNLQPGTYLLEEITKVEGHAALSPNPKEVTIEPTTTNKAIIVETITNEVEQGKLKVDKVNDQKENINNLGITYTIYKGTYPDGVEVSGMNSVRFGAEIWLDPGTEQEGQAYYLIENKHTTYHADNTGVYVYDPTPKSFVIKKGELTYLTNTDEVSNAVINNRRGKLYFDKLASFEDGDSTAEFPLAGATIAIYKAVNGDKTDLITDNKIGNSIVMSTNQYNGSPYLDPGQYWIVEEKSPVGYGDKDGKEVNDQMDIGDKPRTLVEVKANGVTDEETVSTNDALTNHGQLTNYATTASRMKLHKVDGLTGEEIIGHPATFEFYKKVAEGTDGAETVVTQSGDIITVIKIPGYAISQDPSGDLFITDLETGTATSIEHIIDGKNNKADDEYYFKETVAPVGGGYKFPDNPWFGPFKFEEGKLVHAFIANEKNEGEGTKRGPGEDGELIDGAYFALFSNPLDAAAVKGYLQNGGFQNTPDYQFRREELRKELDEKMKNSQYVFTDKDISTTIDGVTYNSKLELGTYGFNKIYRVIKTNEGQIKFEDLAAGGTYTLLELVPLDEYAYNFTSNYTVQVSYDQESGEYKYTYGGSDDPENGLVITNINLGEAKLKKTTKVGGAVLPVKNVKYNVYKAVLNGDKYVKEVPEKIVATGYTDDLGVFKTIPLEAGRYIIEEAARTDYTGSVEAPTSIKLGSAKEGGVEGGEDENMTPELGYTVVEIMAGTTPADAGEFRNTSNYGDFILQKAINFGTDKVADAEYRITFVLRDGEDKQIGDPIVVTVNNGETLSNVYQSTLLATGEYSLTETKIEKKGTGNTYTDVTNQFLFETKKNDGNKLSFTIEAEKTTGMNDTGSIEYYLKDSNPDNHKPIKFDNTKKGTVEVKKTGQYISNDGTTITESLAGVEFKLYDRTGTDNEARTNDIVETNVKGTAITSNATEIKGIATFNNVIPGDYWLVETKMPDNTTGYVTPSLSQQRASAKAIQVNAGETISFTEATGENKAINNISTYGRFKLTKVDTNDDSKGLSAGFKIYKDAEGKVPYSNKEVDFTTANDTGIYTSDLLPAGNYYIQEVVLPSNYDGNRTRVYGPIKVVAGEIAKLEASQTDNTEVKITNDKKFDISISKVSADSSPEKLAKAIIIISTDENKINFSIPEKEEDFEKLLADLKTDNAVYVRETGSDGLAEVNDLTLGGKDSVTYYYREIKAPEEAGEEYILDSTVRNKTVYYTDISANNNKVKIIFDNITNQRKGKLRVDKRGSWEFTTNTTTIVGLGGAKFEVYSVNSEGKADEENVIDTLTTSKIQDGTLGLATSKPLDAGYYALKEIEPPDGYTITEPDKLYYYEVKNNETSVKYYETFEKLKAGNVSADGKDYIPNDADEGSFTLTKFDGKTGDTISTTTHTSLGGSEFEIEKYNENTEKWEDYNEEDPNVNVKAVDDEDGKFIGYGYESGYLPEGLYRAIEVKAPTKALTVDGTELTVNFTLDKTPIEFIIEIGKTTHVVAHNSPKTNVELTKYGNKDNSKTEDEPKKDTITSDDELLDGATFKLTYDVEGKNLVDGTKEETSKAGKVLWKDIDALIVNDKDDRINWVDKNDKYKGIKLYIHETTTGEQTLKDKGYGISTEPIEVVVTPDVSVKSIDNADKLIVKASMINPSLWGVLTVVKTNSDGTKYLSGAEFKIQELDNDGKWVDAKYTNGENATLTSGGTSAGVTSGYLKADENGTQYKVIETQAPYDSEDPFTLDPEHESVEQVVTVYPNRISNVETTVSFKNMRISEITSKDRAIDKTVTDTTKTGYFKEITANSSLIKSPYEAEFLLQGYADPENPNGAHKLEVWDNNIQLKDANGNSLLLNTDKGVVKDYHFSKIVIDKSYNDPDKHPNKSEDDLIVSAEIYIQTSKNEMDTGSWTLSETINDVTNGATITFDESENVVGVKIAFSNVLRGFTSNKINLTANFAQRIDWATINEEPMAEARSIVNTSHVNWIDAIYDYKGNEIKTGEQNKDSVATVKLPSYIEDLPRITLNNEIVRKKHGGYYPGDAIDYKLTATNPTKEELNMAEYDAIFEAPIISWRMPGDVTLVDDFKGADGTGVGYDRGLLVQKLNVETGNTTVIPTSDYQLLKSSVQGDGSSLLHPYTTEGSDGSYNEDSTRTTMEYALQFNESVTLKPGEQIIISFRGTISHDRKVGYTGRNDIDTLIMPAYISSTKYVEPTAENANGMSFRKAYSSDVEVEDTVTDRMIIPATKVIHTYIRDVVSAKVLDSTDVKVFKSIGTMSADNKEINWLTGSSVPSVNPGDYVYYKLTVENNNLSKQLPMIRLFDALPRANDKMLISGGERGSNIPAGDAQHDVVTVEDVQVVNKSTGSKSDNATPIVYYYYEDSVSDYSWSNKTITSVAPMNDKTEDWTKDSHWKTDVPTTDEEKRRVSAIAIDVVFADSGLEVYDSYEVVIKAQVPEFTLDQIEEYANKLFNNSVTLAYDDGINPLSKSQIEPNKVMAKTSLPAGSIGDTVWFDEDANGIQDEDLEDSSYCIANAEVTLMKKTYYKIVGDDTLRHRTETVNAKPEKTDGRGKYLFENLPTNYLKPGLSEDADKTDPNNYIGGEYYSYYVIVKLPKNDDRVPTIKGSGDNRELDSDINALGQMDEIQLWLENSNGQLVPEHRRDQDAGYTKAYSLGNFVWEDYNANGIQDDNEPGVSEVPVKLYRLKNADDIVEATDKPIMSTTTDLGGFYRFTGLQKGYYVVEFDISNLTVSDGNGGYRYQYAFTTANVGEVKPNNMDSDAAHPVDKDERVMRTDTIHLEEYNGTNYDDRWDAGLVLYSALGGFVFDDVDYDDMSSKYRLQMSDIPVELYEVVNGIRGEQPIRTTTTDSEGRYFFDRLLVPKGNDTSGNELYKTYAVKFEFPEEYYAVLGNKDPSETAEDGRAYAVDAKYDNDSTIDSDMDVLLSVEGDSLTQYRIGYISEIRLYNNMISTTWDAGANKRSAIGDFVWLDENKDGLQGPGEERVANVRVVLQSRENQQSAWKNIDRTYTDTNGNYKFVGLKSSKYIDTEYRVIFVLDQWERQVTDLNQREPLKDNEGNILIPATSATDSDALGTYLEDVVPQDPGAIDDGEITGGYPTATIKPDYGEYDDTWDAGLIPVISSVGDYMWIDANYDGIQDDDEEPVPYATVVLEYNYAGVVDSLAVQALNAKAEDNTSRIAGTVIEDSNDGTAFASLVDTQSLGATLMADSGLELQPDENSWKVVATDETDENGMYRIAMLNPGYYRVRFYIPDGFVATKNNRGNGENGSEAAIKLEDNSYYSKIFYLQEDTYDPTLDAGIYQPPEPERKPTVKRIPGNKKINRVTRTVSRKARSVRSGDGNNIGLWILILAGSTVGILIFEDKRKKNKKNSK